jgi:pimeloyl-ACP methyl ester carboxylesterase
MHNANFGVEFVLERPGNDLHYWVTGPQDKPALLFTHGAQVDHTMFASQVNAFSQEYRVITWDLRGHGVSQPYGGGLSYLGIAGDLLALLDRLQLDQAVLIAHSMGGCGVQEVLLQQPNRVRAAVLVGSPCVSAALLKSIESGNKLLSFLTYILPEKVLQKTMQGSANAFSIQPDVQAYIRETSLRVSKKAYQDIYTAVKNGYHEEPSYHIQRPFLLVCGDQDVLAIRKQAPLWAEREPFGQFVSIPQAGHNANQDNPQAFNQAVRAFLDNLKSE